MKEGRVGATHSAERIQAVRRLAGEGMRDREIGAQFGLSKDAIAKIRERNGIPPGKPQAVSSESLAKIKSMAVEGATDVEIGRAVGMTKSAVQAARKRHGIESGRNLQVPVHGTPSMYNSGCRCEACKTYKRERSQRQKAQRAAKVQAGEASFEHGRNGYTNWGCRCEKCTQGQAEAYKGYTAQRRAADPESVKERRRAWRDKHRDRVRAANNQRFVDYQRETSDKAAKHYQHWTSAELEVISRTDISVKEMALLLGRTWNAVQKQRQKMRDAERGKGLQRAQETQASTVRTHGLGGYGRGCRCQTCAEAKSKYRREHGEKVQAETVPEAGNARKEWTGPELEMAARDDLSVKEIALRLGRSYAAVSVIRHKIRHDPKTINFAGIPRGEQPQEGQASSDSPDSPA